MRHPPLLKLDPSQRPAVTDEQDLAVRMTAGELNGSSTNHEGDS